MSSLFRHVSLHRLSQFDNEMNFGKTYEEVIAQLKDELLNEAAERRRLQLQISALSDQVCFVARFMVVWL